MDDCSRKIRRTKECAGESITGKPALDASGAPLAAAALAEKLIGKFIFFLRACADPVFLPMRVCSDSALSGYCGHVENKLR